MRKTRNRVAIPAATFIAALALSAWPAAAETWPQRTVHVIVPFAAGGDAIIRLFAEPLAKRWKQPVVVENRPGAEGMVGVSAFTGMHDDHVLLFFSAAAITTFPLIHERLPYDPARDIVPISSAADTTVSLEASESLKTSSLDAFVAVARARPGKLNYYGQNGGSFALLLPGFVKSAALDMIQVYYREPALAYQDLAMGRIHLMMATLGGAISRAQSGAVRLLAVTNKRRAVLAPELPTMIEAGYPELEFEGLQGFFGPRDMPAGRQNRIAADVRAVAADPGVAGPLAAVGIYVRGSTPAEFAAAIEEQRAKMASLAKSLGTVPAR